MLNRETGGNTDLFLPTIQSHLPSDKTITWSISQVNTLGNISAVKITPARAFDPALPFQGFLVVSKSGDLFLEEDLTY